MNARAALKEYQRISVEAGVTDATPHQLVLMLLRGAMEKLTQAKLALGKGEVAEKGQLISKVIAIVDSLRASLDVEKGGEVALNLGSLYDYAETRLLQANIESDPAMMDEVYQLLGTILAGWEQMPGHEG